MSRPRGELWRSFRALALAVTLFQFSVLLGMEKHAAAHEAEAIVVGTFFPLPSLPWFDGWHIRGEIAISEVLYGADVPRTVRFDVLCPWRLRGEWWPPPEYPESLTVRGLWFLSRSGPRTWSSSLGFSGSGFALLSERSYWEAYIRRHKR